MEIKVTERTIVEADVHLDSAAIQMCFEQPYEFAELIAEQMRPLLSAGKPLLPAPAGSEWWTVLGVPATATADTVRASYRYLVKQHHPDTGGDAEQFLKVQQAYQAWEAMQR